MGRQAATMLAVAAALGIAAAVAFQVHDRSHQSGRAQTPLELTNRKLALHGEPTLAPGTDLSAPLSLPPMSTPTPGPAPTPPPPACGPREGPASLLAITARFGDVRSDCLLINGQWVVTTNGRRAEGVPGVVAVFACARDDSDCLQGGEPRAGQWEYFVAPNNRGVAVLARSGDTLILNNGRQVCFNLLTHAFDTDPGCQ